MKSLIQFITFFLILLAGSFESLASGVPVLKNAEGTTSVEVEPNNNSENANPIYSGVTVSGNFVNGDLDMYSFSLSNPSILTFFSDELYGGVTIYAPDSSVIFKEETFTGIHFK